MSPIKTAFCAAVCMLVIHGAHGTLISIDDLTDSLSVSKDSLIGISGYVETVQAERPDFLIVNPRDGTSSLAPGFGQANINYQYTGSSPPSVDAITASFNIYEPGTGKLSDTLFVHVENRNRGDLTAAPLWAVNLSFTSDNDGAFLLTELANGISIVETGDWQTVETGWSDLSVRFRSDVSEMPEPSTLALFGMAWASFTLSRRRVQRVR